MPSGENKARPQAPTPEEQENKQKRIKSEEKRLMKSFKDIQPDTKSVIDGLIKEAAYMRITLEDWKADLDATGWVELFQQSEKVAPYEKKRPKAEMYLNLNPNYQKIMDKLASYLPKDSGGGDKDDDGFEDFVNEKG